MGCCSPENRLLVILLITVFACLEISVNYVIESAAVSDGILEEAFVPLDSVGGG